MCLCSLLFLSWSFVPVSFPVIVPAPVTAIIHVLVRLPFPFLALVTVLDTVLVIFSIVASIPVFVSVLVLFYVLVLVSHCPYTRILSLSLPVSLSLSLIMSLSLSLFFLLYLSL